MKLARKRFDELKSEAARLPEAKRKSLVNNASGPTLEEEAAYQHAVCTAALGDKKAAEAEYMKFIRDYPESPLTSAAARRIEMLHDGHMPPAAEAAWEAASKISLKRQETRRKKLEEKLAQCGPECLAEIMRRFGEAVDAKALANEMKTNRSGTSLLAISQAAEKHGYSAEGLRLTQKGLAKQHLPLIAFIMPGHYVVVEELTNKEVRIWDPSGAGLSKPARRSIPLDQWNRYWSGIALVVEKSTGKTVRPLRQTPQG